MRFQMQGARRRSRDGRERGGALVLVTVSLVTGLSVLALTIDLGLRFTAHSEVQRAADAAALAGASAFLDYPLAPWDAIGPADSLAREYATKNAILHRPIRDDEVDVDPDDIALTVEVVIRRTGLPTWFARLFGVDSMAVSARAVAQVASFGVTNCTAPWAVVDFWADEDDDQNGNRLPDEKKPWTFDPQRDRYLRVGDGSSGQAETGLGSEFRNGARAGGRNYHNDFGRPITIRPADPSQPPGSPGDYYLWRHDEDGLNGRGYSDRIVDCDPTVIEIGQPYRVKDEGPSGLNNLTRQAVDSLFALDPDARWEESPDPTLGAWTGRVVDSRFVRSPRIVRIPMIDPADVSGGSRVTSAPFNNVGLIFIERPVGPNGEIQGRFLYYVPGTPGGGRTGAPLIRYVHLTG